MGSAADSPIQGMELHRWYRARRLECVLPIQMHLLPYRGFGTVRYATKEAAESSALKMNNQKIGGRTITVRIDRFA